MLIKVRKFVVNDLKGAEEQVKHYIKKNCGLKIFDHNSTINSAYRTVPIIQLYIPFNNEEFRLTGNLCFQPFIIFVFPHITLFGKIVLMLTICRIAVQRRFLFFVIPQ